MDETYVIVYKHKHSEDRYYEDDYGHEYHYLEGKSTFCTIDVKGIENVRKNIEEIGESNADNPPYDEYHFILVYDKDSKEIIPERMIFNG